MECVLSMKAWGSRKGVLSGWNIVFFFFFIDVDLDFFTRYLEKVR